MKAMVCIAHIELPIVQIMINKSTNSEGMTGDEKNTNTMNLISVN